MLAQLAVVTLFLGAQGASDVATIEAQGYVAEEHSVTTADGYILSLQRIPCGKNSGNNTGTRKVVFLMHALLLGSNSYTYLGSDYGIAYNLADAGYDVWMGNSRGNRYSRRHVSLDPDTDKMQFFNYNYEDIALNDLPAMIDYVLATTKQDKLHYIGHAMGGTVFLVLNSMKSAYQSKFYSAHLLGAFAYDKEYPSKNVKLLCSAVDVIYNMCLRAGYVEFNPSSTITTILADSLANTTVQPALLAGAAVKQIVHICQNIRDETFTRFDHGADTNKMKYGGISPPSYDLSKLNVDVTIHYSHNDITLSVTDALLLAKALPNGKAHEIGRDDFSHLDFLESPDVKELVTDKMIECMQKF